MRVTLDQLEDRILPRVEKPNRYLGNIHNLESRPREGRIGVLLAFPDALERAMEPSVAGLLHRVNRLEAAAADLCFTPAPDFATELRAHGLPLPALGSRTPASGFDLVVVPVAREELATGVPELLDLLRLPVLARERGEDGPLVVLGGPVMFNPEPFAGFADLVVVGDLETALDDLVGLALRRRDGALPRAQALRQAAAISGVYVPSLYGTAVGSRGRLLPRPLEGSGAPPSIAPLFALPQGQPDADSAPFLQPLSEIASDRLCVEVARGCSTGCPACRSGFPHRDPAVRPVGDVVAELARGLDATGWEEALLQLPPGAHGVELLTLLERADQVLLGRQLGIALASVGGDELVRPTAERLVRLRRGPLSFAVLAAGVRLRGALGLTPDEEHLLAGVRESQRQGWHSARLGFTVALPGETPEDVEAVPALLKRAQAAVRDLPEAAGKTGAFAGAFQVSASADVFLPRPHTRFEREALADLDDMRARLALLKRRIARGRLYVRRGAAERAWIGGLVARGDRRVGEAVLQAWRLGCLPATLDEPVAADLWLQALAACGLDGQELRAAFAPDEPLPWAMFREPEPTGAGLAAEGDAAAGGLASPASNGPAAGVAGTSNGTAAEPVSGESATPGPDPRLFGRKRRKAPASAAAWQRGLRFRIEYVKGEEVRFTSHLEVMRALERAVRRAGLPLAYSQGQVPHAKMASGPPLPLGFTSRAEYLDLEFSRSVDEGFLAELNACMNRGLEAHEAVVLSGKPASLSAALDTASWRAWMSAPVLKSLGLDAGACAERWGRALEELRRAAQPVAWPVKPGPDARTADARGIARGAAAECRAGVPEIRFDTPVNGGMRPEMFVARLTGLSELDPRLVRVERTGLWVTSGTRRLTPLMAIVSHPGALAAATDWS
ncbi:MAG: DUF2344 domain-containing protein [Candidatus Eisenbacteria bacterium]|nr:DUF2344 domain-containing protein [Candidatus Eisenbacteria bacterium]